MPIVLYVDRNPNPDSIKDELSSNLLRCTQNAIKDEIERRKIGPVNIRYDFLSEEINVELNKGLYGLLITHYPPPYEESLKKILWIKENYKNIKIIIFTGSGVEENTIMSVGVDALVRKEGDVAMNRLKVLRAVENAFFGSNGSNMNEYLFNFFRSR